MKNSVKMVNILAAVAATSTLVFLGAGCSKSNGYTYDDAKRYSVGSASYNATEVREIEIDWLGGNVEIQPSTSGKVEVSEEETAEKQEMRMHYYLDEGVLKIKYCASGWSGTIRDEEKNLRVSVPGGVALDIESGKATVAVGVINVTEFSLDSDRGNFTAERITCDEADIEMYDGQATVGELITKELSVDARSANVTISKLSADVIDAETGSGNFTFGIEKSTRAEMESGSGSVTLSFREGLGVSLHYTTSSGKLITDKEYVKEGNSFEFASQNGERSTFNVRTKSGDLNIR